MSISFGYELNVVVEYFVNVNEFQFEFWRGFKFEFDCLNEQTKLNDLLTYFRNRF